MAIVSFKDVSFQYPNGFSAVENVTFEIEQGEKIAIVGQNGAGKTTTVKMMNGLLKPTKGEVIVDNMNTKDYTTAQLSRVTGYVFQNQTSKFSIIQLEKKLNMVLRIWALMLI